MTFCGIRCPKETTIPIWYPDLVKVSASGGYGIKCNFFCIANSVTGLVLVVEDTMSS